MKKYDYLVVGAGLFGATFAQQMNEHGKHCLVIDRRKHIAGNIYSENKSGIEVHMYGPHIFHTDLENVWGYVNRFAKFNHFRYEPIANYKGQLFHMPFNMNTFHEMWGISTPEEAQKIIDTQRLEITHTPENLEEQAISLVGRDIYEKLVKGYTEKQWGRDCKDLPSFIISRLPVRMRFDNNYFNHPYQGIPINGYTDMVHAMLEGINVELDADYLKDKERFNNLADYVVYTGPIDEYFNYTFGKLQYRSLRFENEELQIKNYQGVAGMNFTDRETPYTRIIEHKHFVFGEQPNTIITKEYPVEWSDGMEPYYPINDERNTKLFSQYKRLANKECNVIFGGRLAEYKYYDMDKVINSALQCVNSIMKGR